MILLSEGDRIGKVKPILTCAESSYSDPIASLWVQTSMFKAIQLSWNYCLIWSIYIRMTCEIICLFKYDHWLHPEEHFFLMDFIIDGVPKHGFFIFTVSRIPVVASQLNISSVNLRFRGSLGSYRTLLSGNWKPVILGWPTSDKSSLCAIPPFVAVPSLPGISFCFSFVFCLFYCFSFFLMLHCRIWERTACSCSSIHFTFP